MMLKSEETGNLIVLISEEKSRTNKFILILWILLTGTWLQTKNFIRSLTGNTSTSGTIECQSENMIWIYFKNDMFDELFFNEDHVYLFS